MSGQIRETDNKLRIGHSDKKALVQVRSAKPQYIPKILSFLQGADPSKYKDGIRPLIEKGYGRNRKGIENALIIMKVCRYMMNPMLVVTDMDKSVEFYKRVLGLRVVTDFGANKTLTGGLALQTLETYKEFIGSKDISFGGNNFEIYFEKDDFDRFAENLGKCDVQYVHQIKEHSWGQRVVRFYDPDRHIIEVGENMKAVCKRFIDRGMTPEQVAERMDVPMEYIDECLR